ncbi:MAG: YdcF family protein [Coriobacteriia bacterium]|nr:YdcF family protein [Coriobacteriia bacterium]
MKYLLRGILRGTALFFGCFSLVNTVVSHLGSARLEDIWWIDLSFLPSAAATVCSVALAVSLIAFAFKPSMGGVRRFLTTGLIVLFALFAVINMLEYYQAYSQGEFTTRFPVPFSFVMCLLFLGLALAAFLMHDYAGKMGEFIIFGLAAVLWLAIFPLAQIAFFGTTNYAKKAEVAVVFGARVYPGYSISLTLQQRMASGIDLYERGLVKKIYLTGGIDADGIDETIGMKRYALTQGVPARAIIIDNKGDNTDLSVANTVAYFKKHNITKVLAVSQFYHLPRIKMAYRAKHFNVRTVPAFRTQRVSGEEFTTLREIPAFWVYWLRSGFRDVNHVSIFNSELARAKALLGVN